MNTPLSESKRLKTFRLEEAKIIPKFPNDKNTLQILQSMSLSDILIASMSWRLRYVRPAVRRVEIDCSLTADPRWKSLSSEINCFLDKVKRGDDITPYLSLQPHTRGFTPSLNGLTGWEDKDFLLNAMGFHHFHLAAAPNRTNDVLFALVFREVFEVIGIFNHDVFENEDPKAMIAEREKLWQAFEDRQKRDAVPGDIIIGGLGVGGWGIATSGIPVKLVMAAMDYKKMMVDYDPKLDDPSFLAAYLQQNKNEKFKWEFKGKSLDLGILAKKSKVFYLLKKGPN